MKSQPLIIIAKLKSPNNENTWQYRLENDAQIYGVKLSGDFVGQILTLVKTILTRHYTPTTKVTIIPLMVLPEKFLTELKINLFNTTWVLPVQVATRERLRNLFGIKQKRTKDLFTLPASKDLETTYIATDAGGASDLYGTNLWAWVREDSTNPTFNYSTTPLKHTHHAELEAILRAIIDNKEVTKLHIYSDATTAIESYEAYFSENKIINKIDIPYLQPLLQEVKNIVANMEVTLEWTRAHSNFYLNEIADTLITLAHPKNYTPITPYNLEVLSRLFSSKFPAIETEINQ